MKRGRRFLGGPCQPFSTEDPLDGGRIYLTDCRLLFAPYKFDEKLAGHPWSARLVDLDRAFVKGPLKTVRVAANDGGEQGFVIWPRVKSAATIDAAIQAAKVNPVA